MEKAVGILGLGCYVPEKVLTNHDLEKIVETSDDRNLSVVEGNSFKNFSQTFGSRLHKSTVERCAYGKKNSAFGAGFFQRRQSFIHCAYRACNLSLIHI